MSECLSHKDARLQLAKWKGKLESLKVHQSRIHKELTKAMKEVEHLETYLKSPNGDIDISDHAIVRYVERFMKIDIDRIKNNIVTKEIKIKHAFVGDGTYPLNDKLSTVIRGNVATTVLENKKSWMTKNENR